MTLMQVLPHAIAEELEELEREQKWHIFAKRTEATEDEFKPKLQAAFTKQETSVQAKLKNTPVPQLSKAGGEEAEAASEAYVDAIYTASAWQVPFETMALPFMTIAYKEAGQAAFVEVGATGSFNVTNPRAKKYLQDKVFKFAEDVNDETREKIRRALVKGLDAGESIPDISKRIAGVFDINRDSRTDKIARTEIVGASNNGTHTGYVESGIVETKMWISSRDTRVRDLHTIDGEERKLNEPYSNGLLHPHDPNGTAENVINCRCTESAGKLKEAA